jgi:hypothetical protein
MRRADFAGLQPNQTRHCFDVVNSLLPLPHKTRANAAATAQEKY